MLVSILMLGIPIIVIYNLFQNRELIANTNNKKVQNNGLLSIMLETNSGSGEYTQSETNKFPASGYLFNETLSGCENNGTLTYDKAKKKVILKNNISDKCYVYFDKITLPSIKVTSSSVTPTSITVNVTGTKGTNIISKYMYSIDNKATWVTKTTSATTSSHTFSNLTSNKEYTIYIKIIDIENNETEINTKVRTGLTGAQKIKNLYTSQGANNLYHHDGTLENGINDGSYRYAGSYETTNNWVCFGTSATTCDNEHLYRIIGVFGEQLKLIKAYEGTQTSLGTAANGNGEKYEYYKGVSSKIPSYFWSGSNTNSSNDWTASTLNKNILNGTYLTTLGTAWANKIANSQWKIGGSDNDKIWVEIPSSAYQNEVVNTYENKTTNAKVGLMYASDYGFAASSNNWTTTLITYDNSTNRNNNWMFLGMGEWTITPVVSKTEAYIIGYGGRVGCFTVTDHSFGAVRPVFYLNSNIEITSGTGTKTNPYRIS